MRFSSSFPSSFSIFSDDLFSIYIQKNKRVLKEEEEHMKTRADFDFIREQRQKERESSLHLDMCLENNRA